MPEIRSMEMARVLQSIHYRDAFSPASQAEVGHWTRIYSGARFSVGGRTEGHSGYSIIPAGMLPEDWTFLRSYFSADIYALYLEALEMSHRPLRRKYVRHYEIEPLPLPGA